ncbi:MAG: hypothetical protein COA67_00335 [Lutibacter sp.]|nr:MAG: hypothetical protein COA67_00335 [Lutibacter sp.]
MKSIKILIPIPSYGFDTTEVAVPWKLFSENNFEVVFATPNGEIGITDQSMLHGTKLGIWKSALMARKDAVEAHNELIKVSNFQKPLKYSELKETDFDALLLPGGHDKKVKEYLESTLLQNLVVDFFNADKPVAAVCHGVVLAARSINQKTGKSVLHNLKTTSLLKSQELLAYNLTRLWLGDYYLTYPEITVEDEVVATLSDKKNFIKGPTPILRDDMNHLNRGFAVTCKNYVSARWPGDIYTFSLDFIKLIKKHYV